MKLIVNERILYYLGRGIEEYVTNLVMVKSYKLVTEEGQKHVTEKEDEIKLYLIKILLRFNHFIGLRLNCQIVSYFWSDTTIGYNIIAVRHINSCLLVKIYRKDTQELWNYQTHLGQITKTQPDKIDIKLSDVINITGEMCKPTTHDRGSVVGCITKNYMNRRGETKGPKLWTSFDRKYSTTKKTKNSLHWVISEYEKIGFEELIRHWKNCKKKNKIYYDLNGYLKTS